MPCGVYSIRHILSGKRYIGSSVHVTGRWTHHRYHLRRGLHYNLEMQEDWNRDGENSFVFEWIEKYPSGSLIYKELNALEEKYLGGPNLYNKGTKACGGFKLSDAQKLKLSKAAKRVAADPVERERRSKRAKEQHRTGNFGKRKYGQTKKM